MVSAALVHLLLLLRGMASLDLAPLGLQLLLSQPMCLEILDLELRQLLLPYGCLHLVDPVHGAGLVSTLLFFRGSA